ncbi:DNA-binding transcriptional regulator Fis [endosymbiont of unidentified scaly snail isolate Monju]|uniref:DNA-binding transcriptional regulator Fis n=1 Tax=endosymbiont of unidentified scaly snail isolate Monju TaxID=1248727 RepID=UPI0003892852|nr:DNA-binding transcriptional regulator Fis [endosymbiont of unidentified scaly snail isolate Monju]BAN69833.1 Fis family transcriptional regulator, factor for inversion stimulation protein [endosymbiont of unidentified scaly snail isolate Monju]
MTLIANESAPHPGNPSGNGQQRQGAPLSLMVRQALDEYFAQLDGTEHRDLYQMVMAQAEQPLLERVMLHTGGNQTRAAQLLGISRATLRKKLALYNLV